MAKWIYKRYNLLISWSEEVFERDWELTSSTRTLWSNEPQWNGDKYSGVGYEETRREKGWLFNNGAEICYKEYCDIDTDDDIPWRMDIQRWTRTKLYAQGTYVGEVIAEDGTYPDNGRSGNYWYVKDRLAFPELKLRIAGAWRAAEMGWVNINGTWREITDTWGNINGTWRKSE